MNMPAYMTIEEFLEFFERGLRGHFEGSVSVFPNHDKEKDTHHVEDLAYQAEFFAENFARIMSAISWKEGKSGR